MPNNSGQNSTGLSSTPTPIYRRLRGYAFDPSLSIELDTAIINKNVYKVKWEALGWKDSKGDTKPGLVGEYLEVVDYDPASQCFYSSVNLDDPHLLAQDGLPPSEGNPQFHQQMVYAVAMTTIQHFERALGRPALWAPRNYDEKQHSQDKYVPRLRIYPHALREANAYYSPDKKALLFGYFSASSDRPDRILPGGMVFTCLSHDIIAHETTHALLDGMHRRYIEPTHRDSLAFHEAFADIVALFQHFSYSSVLRHQISRTRGDLFSQNLLGELAQQFGEAIGNRGALRSFIGQKNRETDKWEPHKPNPDEYEITTEPHARGAILVAAIFDAFLSIYKRRVADLMRIASSGTGILPAGELHPDLVNRLASEAAKSAQHVLQICIRALDYCPPVDINFGDYLRAIITADFDLVPDDELGYRIAFIEAFRRRGIYPRDVRTLSVESLRWERVDKSLEIDQQIIDPDANWFRNQSHQFYYFEKREDLYTRTNYACAELNSWLKKLQGTPVLEKFGKVTGITFDANSKLEGLRFGELPTHKMPKFEVHSLRPARRVGPDGEELNQLIISLMQTREVAVDPPTNDSSTMLFRGGCTLILDLDKMEIRYAIKKDIDDEARLERHRNYRKSLMMDGSLRDTYFRLLENSDPAFNSPPNGGAEPLALLHRSYDYGRP